MHLVVFPGAYIFVSVLLDHRALTRFLSCLKIAIVLSTVIESQLALSFKLVFNELTFVCLFRLSKVVDSETVEHTILEITFVKASIRPFVATSTALFALHVLAFKLNGPVFPSFLAKSMLQVVDPGAVRS